MRFARPATALVSGLLLAVASAGTALAGPVSDDEGAGTQSVDCFVDNPDDYNGRSWTMHERGEAYYNGQATFNEYGETLIVKDTMSNGRRTVAIVNWCDNGSFVPYGRYNSGPDEGATDTEKHDLAFREGLKLQIYVCDHDEHGYHDCGDTFTVVS